MKHSNLRFPALFFSLCSLCLCGELFAEQSEIDELRRRIEELERRLSTIEAADDGGAAAHGAFAGWEEGRFTLRSADSDYELKVGGHIQVDGRFPFDGPRAGENQIFVPRVRMIFDGRVARFFEYEIEYEFGRGFGPAGDDRSPRLLDAYLNFAFIDQAQIKAGRYKVPFSIDELVSSDSTRLIRRSIINRFAPSRETGVTIQGDAGGVSYAAGVFDDDAPDDFLYAGRFTLEPGIFAPEFWVAVNGYYEHNRGVALPARRFGTLFTDLQTTFFRFADGAVSDGSRYALGADAGYWGTPLGLLAEYIVFEQDAQIGAASDTLLNHAWYVQASYVLTGEPAKFDGVSPERPLDPQRGTWGAFEIAARYAEVLIDSDTFPLYAAADSARRTQAITTGVNWYMNINVRVMVNYVYSRFSERIEGDRRENGVLFRFQVDF